jgi:uncharacterized membrane protein (DUF106 family)
MRLPRFLYPSSLLAGYFLLVGICWLPFAVILRVISKRFRYKDVGSDLFTACMIVAIIFTLPFAFIYNVIADAIEWRRMRKRLEAYEASVKKETEKNWSVKGP